MNLNRFPRVNQNTALTCVFMTGFEFNDQARDKIQSASGYTNVNTSPTPHQLSGNGGSRYGRCTNVIGAFFLGIPSLKEFVVCSAVHIPSAVDTGVIDMYDSGNSSSQCNLVFNGTTGTIVLRRATTTLATSSVSSFATNSWNWVHWWGYIEDLTGFAHVRVGSWANEVLSATGQDTKATVSNTADVARISTNASAVANFDDFMIFARSMYYHGGSGTLPSVNQTITGGTSGATAVITHVFDTSNSGCFFVRTVSGTFQVGESLSNGAGWTGIANNALGNNEASLWVKEQYIFTRAINGDVLKGWSNTTSGAGDHWTEVDDAATTTDFISTNTANQVDEYTTTGSLPPGAEIEAVCVSALARLNGVSSVNNIRVGLDDGAADIDADADSPLSGSYEVHDMIFTNNPNTGVKYTTTEIGNSHPRVTSKT